MAIKFTKGGCTFPTEIKDGVLSVTVGPFVYQYDFGWCPYAFPKDHSYWATNAIMLYSTNDDGVTIIVRIDGSVTFYREGGIVIGRTTIPVPRLNGWTIEKKFSVTRDIIDPEDVQVYQVLFYKRFEEDFAIFDAANKISYILLTPETAPHIFSEEKEALYFTPVCTMDYTGKDGIVVIAKSDGAWFDKGIEIQPSCNICLV